MAITTYDKYIDACNRESAYMFLKAGPATQLAGGLTSLWRVGTIPTQPGIPTATADICTKATVGAYNYPSPAGSNTAYLGSISFGNTVAHTVFLFDRLAHNGALVANSTAAVTLNMTLPEGRGVASNGVGSYWFYEIYADIGTTGTTLTAKCTKSDGASVDIAVAIGGASPANRAGRLFPILPSGDYSIKSIEQVRLTATTGTAGSYGIVGAYLITGVWGGVANIGMMWDYAQLNLPHLASNSCLWFALIAGNATTGTIQGTFSIIDG